MTSVIECVPNISEGADTRRVAEIVEAVRSAPGVRLLDASSDASHNRSVLTIVGDADGIRAAVEALKQWQYSPLVLNGIKTPFVLTVTFNFSVAHK